MNCFTGFQVDVENTNRTPSPLPLARNLPSGENCRTVIPFVWPEGRVMSREYREVAMERERDAELCLVFVAW